MTELDEGGGPPEEFGWSPAHPDDEIPYPPGLTGTARLNWEVLFRLNNGFSRFVRNDVCRIFNDGTTVALALANNPMGCPNGDTRPSSSRS